MAQFKTWLVCQVCGRAAPREASEGWLDQPHRRAEDVRVVRCPQHWSEWALRHTQEGRTKKNRAAMQAALAMPEPVIPAHAGPFPTMEREEKKWHGKQTTPAASGLREEDKVRQGHSL